MKRDLKHGTWALLVALAATAASWAGPPTAAVTGVKATPVTLSRVDLRWEPVPGAQRYHVYRGTGADFRAGDDTWIAATAEACCSNRELKPATTYWYRVAAVLDGKEGRPSEAVSGTTRHKDLALVADGTRRIVEGDAFEITWDARRGGEITGIRQYDGLNWVSVLGAARSGHRDTVPHYSIRETDGSIYELGAAPEAAFRVVKETPDEIVFEVQSSARTEGGKPSAWQIAQTYRVFKEGVLFCDLAISLPPGAPPAEIARAEMGLRLDSALTARKFNWGYYTRSSWALVTSKSASDEVVEPSMLPYVAIDYGLGARGSYTNHVAFFVEDWRAMAGAKEAAGCRFAPNDRGGMDYTWILQDGKGRFKAGQVYRNRWGMCLGAMRKTSRQNLSASRGNNLVGVRYYHTSCKQGHPADQSPDDWPWFVQPRFWAQPAPADVYPSDETIDQAAALGANIFVLHQSWMRCGGSNNWPPADYTPQNPAELKRVIDRCHAKKMRVGLYMRGTEAYALYMPYWEQFCQRDYDGLYVDWSGLRCHDMNLAQGCFTPSDTRFHAYAYFRYTKMLRKRVGENGFLIGHTGAAPSMLALAVFDAYLPGEFKEQKAHLLDSPDAHVLYGMGTYCGTLPISYTAPHEKAVAYSAGLGTWLQLEQGPLWQILRSVPMERAWVYNSLTENLPVVASTNAEFHTTVYKIDRDLLLAVTANFGPKAGTALCLDTAALGMVGSYEVTPLTGREPEGAAPAPVGRTIDGRIQVPALDQYEIRAYRLKRVAPDAAAN